MLTADIKPWMENWFETKPAIAGRFSPTGEDYVEFATKAFSEEDAVSLMCLRLRDYARGRTGYLYWRVVPETHQFELLDDNSKMMGRPTFNIVPFHSVYCRLLVSNEPVA